MSPPMPALSGSTRPSMAAVATAASAELPPSWRMRNPACAASDWLVATTPWRATTSARVCPPQPPSLLPRTALMATPGSVADAVGRPKGVALAFVVTGLRAASLAALVAAPAAWRRGRGGGRELARRRRHRARQRRRHRSRRFCGQGRGWQGKCKVAGVLSRGASWEGVGASLTARRPSYRRTFDRRGCRRGLTGHPSPDAARERPQKQPRSITRLLAPTRPRCPKTFRHSP